MSLSEAHTRLHSEPLPLFGGGEQWPLVGGGLTPHEISAQALDWTYRLVVPEYGPNESAQEMRWLMWRAITGRELSVGPDPETGGAPHGPQEAFSAAPGVTLV